jgi:hypothetical protein
MKVIPTDILDKDGNLQRIEYHDFAGNFQIQVEWDERDEQTSEKRDAFRKWAKTAIERLDFEIEG